MQKSLSSLRSHPKLRRVLQVVAACSALLVVALLYVALIGIVIDASALRGNIARMLSETVGREVRFEGPLQLEVSAHPKLRIGGLHLANETGFGGGELVSLGEARLGLDLWPLFMWRLQIEELAGSDVRVRLQSKPDGSNNWTLKPSQVKPQSVAAPGEGNTLALGEVLAALDIERVSLENLRVEFIGADAKRHDFDLQSLLARFPADKPLTLSLQGKVEKQYPYKLDFVGGMLADLTHPEKPWPVDLSLDFMNSRLSLNGSVSGNHGVINFGLGTEDISEFERLLQTKLPPVGIASVSGTVNYAPGKVVLENLNGVMGNTQLNGKLDFDYRSTRPKITGELTLPVLDLRPFMTDKPATKAEPPRSLAEVYRELSNATFDLKALNRADADLTLRVGQWLSLPGSVHDAMLQVKLEQGRLTVPLQVTVADVVLSGSASADARVSPARFQLALGTHDSSLGDLAKLLAGIPDVQGQLQRFDLRIAARGDRGSALMESLDVRLDIERGKLTYGNHAGGKPVSFALDRFAVALPAGKPLQGDIQGALLDKPVVVTLRGGDLVTMMREERVPLDFKLQAASASVKVAGVLQSPRNGLGSQLSFELLAPHSGEIASWLGLKPGSDVPVSIKGVARAHQDTWQLGDLAVQLGKTVLTAEVKRTLEQGKALLSVQLASPMIDVAELEALLPQSEKKSPSSTPSAAALLDIPILPNGISLADADIEVRLKRISSASPLTLRDLSFDGRIRNGMMSASPFAANIADIGFTGAIALDLRTQQPSAGLWLAADGMDVGALLNKLGLAKELDARIDRLRLYLDLHASRLGQMLAQSALTINFEGGHLALRDANTGAKMRIDLNSGELKAAAGDAVYLHLNGALDEVPVMIGIETASTATLIDAKTPIPLKLTAQTSGVTMQLSGSLIRPLGEAVELDLEMKGGHFADLDRLVHTSLPPWGPWSVSGRFKTSASGYEVAKLALQVGSSQLNGYGKLDTRAVPPRIDIALDSPLIQLNDFNTGAWSPEKKAAPVAAQPAAKGELRKKTAAASDQAQQVLSQAVLRRQNAYLTVRVDQVASGKDVLGSGKLDAKVENGRADIGPVVLNVPGGSAQLWLGYEPGSNDVAVDLRSKVSRFDYGVLARRMDPKTDMRGIFSLDIDVSGRARYLSEILRTGNGHIDFAVWPENMKSGVLDIWAVNVLVALLPVVDPAQASKVNCAMGRFVLDNGKLSDKSILIDTSRMRVKGKGNADFAAETFRLYVQPKAKTPQFLSLALPIEVQGRFDDFHVGVRASDVFDFIGDIATSVVRVPYQMLFGKTLPADGRDVCVAPI